MNWKQWPHPPDIVLGEHHINFLISFLFLRKDPLYPHIPHKIKDDLQIAFWSLWTPSKELKQEEKSAIILFEWISVLESDKTVLTLIDKLLPTPKISQTPIQASGIFSDYSQVTNEILHDTWLQSFLQLSQLFQDLRYSSNTSPLTKKTQKTMGSYYTPPEIIIYMLSRLHSEINMACTRRTEPIRIVDYACGMGAFLFYAAAFLSPKVHAVSFWGLDSDPFAIQAAQICKIFLSSHPKFETTFTSIHFLQKDSLTPLTKENLLCLETDNKTHLEKISSDPSPFGENCLDFIISNPPYKSYGLGRVETLRHELEEAYRKHFSHSAEYKISLYSLFIERAVQMLRPGGFGAVIIPDSFLMGKYFRKLRHFLLNFTILHEIALFRRNFWIMADSGKPVILLFQKKSHPSPPGSDMMITRMLDFSDSELKLVKRYSMNPASFLALHETRFRLFFSTDDERFVQGCEKYSFPLKYFFEIHHGIRSKRGIGKAAITGKIQINGSWKRGLISGTSVQPFSIGYQGDYIHINPELLYSGGFDPLHIAQEKMILRRTGDRLIGAVDTSGLYHTNTLLYLIPLPDSYLKQNVCPSLYALCAVLNSEVFNRYYQIISLKAHRTLPQVEIDMLHELPIKIRPEHKIEYHKLDRLSRKLHQCEKKLQKAIVSEIEKLVTNLYQGVNGHSSNGMEKGFDRFSK